MDHEPHEKYDCNGEKILDNRELVNKLISLLITNQDKIPLVLLEKMRNQIDAILRKER